MTHIDELERTILEDARAYIEPRSADEERVLARLSADLGLSGVVTVSGVAPLKRSAPTRFGRLFATRRAVALSFALLGGSAGFAFGYLVGQRSNHAEVAVPTASPSAMVAVRELALEPPSARAPDDLAKNTALAPSRVTVPRATSAESTTHRRGSISEPESSSNPPEVVDPIGEEVALLKRAERAIRAKNPLLALGLLRELDQRFPRGKLLDERAAARVMANCLDLTPDAARLSGEAYLRSAKSSVYHERVRQLCGISEVDPSQKMGKSEKASPEPETNHYQTAPD